MGVQRLFSTFPNAWPGGGLLILRLTAALCLIGVASVTAYLTDAMTWLARGVSLAVAMLLIVGLWTPLAALAEAVIQIGSMTFGHQCNLSAMTASALGLGLSMLGPGAWSVDAWLFGRKRII